MGRDGTRRDGTGRRGRIGSRGFSFGKNLADWALFFRETTVPLYPFVLEMLISRSGCSFRWLFGGIGVDPKPAFPTRITFDPVLEMLISRSLLIVVESAFCTAFGLIFGVDDFFASRGVAVGDHALHATAMGRKK